METNLGISPVLFWFFSALAIFCASAVVLKKNPVAAALNLVLVFFSVAGIYALMGAHLIAGLQILVYAGAIMVLFVFVIMLLAADVPYLDLRRSPVWFHGLVLVGGVLALLVLVTRVFWAPIPAQKLGHYTPEYIESVGGNTRVLARALFSEYLFPFELTSILLLAAIVGVVAIAMRKKRKGVSHS